MADCIRREDALFALRKAERGGRMTALTRLERAYAEIREMPAADVAEVAHAKWILDRYPCLPARECSRCTIMIPWMKQVPEQFWQYCPNCGARMDGAAE